jgi:spore coat protein CotF
MVQLTQKERTLLTELKSQEDTLRSKISRYSSQAKDPKLQQLFSSLSQKERTHYDSITSILSGQIPNVQASSQTSQQSGQSSSQSTTQSGMRMTSSQQGASTQSSQTSQSWQMGSSQTSSSQGSTGSTAISGDKALCMDMLSTEKHVSSTYDTVIFECSDTNIRQVLNHIQKEEQEHGEQLFNYMQSNGMYNVS